MKNAYAFEIIAALILFVLFAGTPDLHDALIERLRVQPCTEGK